MSLARQHRDRIAAATLAQTAPVLSSGGGLAPAPADETEVARPEGISPAAAQILMRLTFDLRRLKEIKAVDLKIAAKREMLPEYRAWCDGLLEAGRAAEGDALPGLGADEVLPTIMVWSIDVGDWPRALELAEHVLRFDVPMPGRYERDAATLVLEEIAEAAHRAQLQGARFPRDVLEAVADLTDGIDMHDQPRAKLVKAIGIELARESEAHPAGHPDQIGLAKAALIALQRAQALNPRVGVKTELKRLQKTLAAQALAAAAEPETTGEAGGNKELVP